MFQRKLFLSPLPPSLSPGPSSSCLTLVICTHTNRKPRFSLLDEKFVQIVAKGLRASSKGETDMIAKALNPVLLCAAAGSGDLKGIQMILDSGGNPNTGDYDHRTPLHLAAAEGHLEITKVLVLSGASVHAKDRFGTTPLQEALLNKRDEVATFLRCLFLFLFATVVVVLVFDVNPQPSLMPRL